MRSLSFVAMALVGVVGAGCVGIGTASAQATPPATVPDAFAQALAARQVADYARRQKDVAAMVTAARMLQELPVKDTGAAPDAGFSADGLFAEAKAMAGDNDVLQQQIRVAQSTGSRGVLASAFGRGLVRSVQTVNPQAAYRFNVTAAGGQPLRVGAIGDLGTSLAMRVQDAGGKTVCMDDNADYAPVCQLTPNKSGQYRIDILNKSGAKSRAVILSN